MSDRAYRLALKTRVDALTWKEQEFLATAFIKIRRELRLAVKRLKK